jgi:hypothetical protein
MTAKFAGAANVPFLLLQLQLLQIVLNARNLLARNKIALFAIPWLVISNPRAGFYPPFASVTIILRDWIVCCSGCSLGCSETYCRCPISDF